MSRIFALALVALLGLSEAAQVKREVYFSTAAVDENKEFEEVRSYAEKEDFKKELAQVQKDSERYKMQFMAREDREKQTEKYLAKQHEDEMFKLKLMQGTRQADGLIHLENGETYFPSGELVRGVNANQV